MVCVWWLGVGVGVVLMLAATRSRAELIQDNIDEDCAAVAVWWRPAAGGAGGAGGRLRVRCDILAPRTRTGDSRPTTDITLIQHTVHAYEQTEIQVAEGGEVGLATSASETRSITCRALCRTHVEYYEALLPGWNSTIRPKGIEPIVRIRVMNESLQQTSDGGRGRVVVRAGGRVGVTCEAARLPAHTPTYLYIALRDARRGREWEVAGAQVGGRESLVTSLVASPRCDGCEVYCMARWFARPPHGEPAAVRSHTLRLRVIDDDLDCNTSGWTALSVCVCVSGWGAALAALLTLWAMRRRHPAVPNIRLTEHTYFEPTPMMTKTNKPEVSEYACVLVTGEGPPPPPPPNSAPAPVPAPAPAPAPGEPLYHNTDLMSRPPLHPIKSHSNVTYAYNY